VLTRRVTLEARAQENADELRITGEVRSGERGWSPLPNAEA